ncbi:MAG: sugar phosphate nucleotidyltransferase, partial [Oscillospiraceae bacterium]
MAGGEGRRLKAVTGDLPKPRVPLLGKPLMERTVEL